MKKYLIYIKLFTWIIGLVLSIDSIFCSFYKYTNAIDSYNQDWFLIWTVIFSICFVWFILMFILFSFWICKQNI